MWHISLFFNSPLLQSSGASQIHQSEIHTVTCTCTCTCTTACLPVSSHSCCPPMSSTFISSSLSFLLSPSLIHSSRWIFNLSHAYIIGSAALLLARKSIDSSLPTLYIQCTCSSTCKILSIQWWMLALACHCLAPTFKKDSGRSLHTSSW